MDGISSKEKNHPRKIDVLSRELPKHLCGAEITMHEDIEKLITYSKKKKLPPLGREDLQNLLRASKHNLKKAQDRLKRYHDMRYKMGEFFEEWMDIELMRKVIELNIVGVLPYRDDNLCVIMFTRGEPWKPEICDLNVPTVTFIILAMFLTTSPLTATVGLKYICDIQANHLHEYYLYYTKFRDYIYILKAIAVRARSAEIIRDNFLVHNLYKLLRPFLPTKLQTRVRLHGHNQESLHEEIDVKFLPEDFGGQLGPIQTDFFIDEFLEFAKKFKIENKFYLNHKKS